MGRMEKWIVVIFVILMAVWAGLIVKHKLDGKPICYENRPAPVEMCVERCVGRYFDNFFSGGMFLGQSGRPLPGLTQENIFDRVIEICADQYSNGCYVQSAGFINGFTTSPQSCTY